MVWKQIYLAVLIIITCENAYNKGDVRWPPNGTKTEKSTHPNCVNMEVAIKKTHTHMHL